MRRTLTDGDVRRLDLAAEPASVAKARAFVRRLLDAWELNTLSDTTCLLTSELATNAVLHARTSYAVVVSRSGEGVRVDVLDDSAAIPQRRHNTLSAATGRGVALVDRLAGEWGATPQHELLGFVKGVWFTVPTAGTGEGSWDDEWLQGR